MTNSVPLPEDAVRVSSIQRFSLHDGPGIRTTVFLQGCPLRCPWCANPETQEISGGRMERIEAIMTTIARDADYYRNSGGGVTFSGGEPFLQPGALMALLRSCREAGFHTAVETCGEVTTDVLLEAGPITDLFLFDIKHCDPARFREVCKGDLGRILHNLKALSGSGEVIARIPCIPGFNLDEKTMRDIFDIAAGAGIREAHLLPYHTLAVDKYAKLGREYTWSRKSLSKEELEPFAQMGREAGLTIKIGG